MTGKICFKNSKYAVQLKYQTELLQLISRVGFLSLLVLFLMHPDDFCALLMMTCQIIRLASLCRKDFEDVAPLKKMHLVDVFLIYL